MNAKRIPAPGKSRVVAWMGIGLLAISLVPARAAANPPNVLMIAVDDLNHWVHHLGRNPQVITPNIDRLARQGVTFHHAYSPSAICNASRTCMLSGYRPGTTGVYGNANDWRTVLPEGRTLPAFFKQNGYHVAGAGKIFHGGYNRLSEWDDYSKNRVSEREEDAGETIETRAVRHPVGPYWVTELPGGDDAGPDYKTALWTIGELQKPQDKPFFLACGIFRPHMPWAVPKKYFDLYPPADQLQLPPFLEGDLDDLPNKHSASADFARIRQEGAWREGIRGYLAAISYADAQIGRVLDALDQSAYRSNTIVILWGDHGWHLGEKHHWRKMTLWEEGTRAPYIWVVPGVTQPGGVCRRPVDMMSLWPTLAELCGLRAPADNEGVSIKPLLANPSADWKIPAVSTYHFNNHTARSERWRYIRYNNGGEELYDETLDPYEWTNLLSSVNSTAAAGVDTRAIVAELSGWLPKLNRTLDEAAAVLGGTNAAPGAEEPRAARRNRRRNNTPATE